MLGCVSRLTHKINEGMGHEAEERGKKKSKGVGKNEFGIYDTSEKFYYFQCLHETERKTH